MMNSKTYKMDGENPEKPPRGHCAWRAILIISHLFVLVVTLVVNFLSAGTFSTPQGMYLSNTGNISDKYPTLITPAGWTFSIWGFIYTWQVLHAIYSLTLLCRKDQHGRYLYTGSSHIHFSFYMVYLLNNMFNIGWIFLFDREFLEASLVFLCLITVTLYICGVLVCVYLDKSAAYLESSGNTKDIWLTRMLVLNGVVFYGTWVSIATLLNLSIVLQHVAGVDGETCAWITVAVLTVDVIVWFILETFVFDRYLRYCFSQYIVLVVAFSGVLSKNYDPASPKPYYLYIIVLLAVSAALGLVKVVVMFWRGCKSPISYNQISS